MVEESIVPLVLTTEVCETPERVRANLEATLHRKYKPLTGLLQSKEGAVSLVGSGPSLVDQISALTGDVIACNASHDFLVHHGKIPTYGMTWDADRVVNRFITPHPDVQYLLASRCHPAVFERFKDNDVVVWHALGDECLQGLLESSNRREPMIGGGSAAVVRAMFLAVAIGYTELHLFGADSSYDGEKTHFQPSVVPEGRLKVLCCGKWFVTAPWMAVQVEDFKLIGPALRSSGAEIIVHGSGLLPTVAEELGFTVLTT